LASLIDENIQVSIKEAYSNLVWYTRTDLTDDEAAVADLACSVRLRACLDDVEKKYSQAVENPGFIFNENEDFLIKRHFTAILDRENQNTARIFKFIDEKEFDPAVAIQGPKVVLMGIIATLFQRLDHSDKCAQIAGMLQTSSGTMAVFEASYLSKSNLLKQIFIF
jgi:hypothetical protein